jgi:hypothetical protein
VVRKRINSMMDVIEVNSPVSIVYAINLESLLDIRLSRIVLRDCARLNL